ncbi:MAG: hypothetical protein HY540_07750 [Deltaproteobacteria bacterium]|nr:hypothetical protein [Deltaproteobacteria bacterium]
MSGIAEIRPNDIKAQSTSKGLGTTKDFNAFLGAVDAFGPAGATATQMYGDVNSATVLSAAFSGVSSLRAQTAPSYAYGGAAMTGDYTQAMLKGGSPGLAGGGANPVIPGTEGFSQADMINTMNQNNLQLLELQAVLQSNMQAWNTKSNILSADHRARMTMIEKFTVR